MRKRIGLLVLLAFLAIPALSFGQAVAYITIVKVPAPKVTEYAAAVKGLTPLMQKHAPSASVRIWHNTLAGEASNQLIVVVEFANMAEFGAGMPKLTADPEYQRALRQFESMGREIVSVMLETEITP